MRFWGFWFIIYPFRRSEWIKEFVFVLSYPFWRSEWIKRCVFVSIYPFWHSRREKKKKEKKINSIYIYRSGIPNGKKFFYNG